MRPRVHRELVPEHVLGLKHLWPGEGARANDEEGCLDVLLVQEVEQSRRVRRRAVVEGGAPVHLVRAVRDVGRAGAAPRKGRQRERAAYGRESLTNARTSTSTSRPPRRP